MSETLAKSNFCFGYFFPLDFPAVHFPILQVVYHDPEFIMCLQSFMYVISFNPHNHLWVKYDLQMAKLKLRDINKLPKFPQLGKRGAES